MHMSCDRVPHFSLAALPFVYMAGHATVSAKKCHSRSRSKSRERGEEVAPCLYASAQMFVDLMGGRYDWGTDLVNQNEEPAAIFCSQDIEILHVVIYCVCVCMHKHTYYDCKRAY